MFHILMHPSRDAVTSWKALCGLRIADVTMSWWLPGAPEERVETTRPVAVEDTLTDEPIIVKKYLCR
jgi:hypothetical protein